jgi:uncharacterized protein (DUF2267 family)
MTIPPTLAHGVQQIQEWLKELRDNADLADEAEALSVLRGVLHQLRDRLTPEEAIELGAQLPVIVRGIYYEGWRPSRTPEKVRSRQKFLDEVTMKLLPRRAASRPKPSSRTCLPSLPTTAIRARLAT